MLSRAYGLALLLCKATVAFTVLASPARAEEPVRIIAFGDSLVHGYGLPSAEAFPAQLEAWLNANGHGPVTVINHGVSGDTTAGGRARIGWALGEGADAVVIVLGGNDLLRGLEPANSRENLDALLTELDAQRIPALLGGMRAPLNYGADWQRDFDAIYPDMAAKHGAILVESFLAPVMDHPEMIQPDGIHPSAEGVAAIVAAMGPQVVELIGRARAK